MRKINISDSMSKSSRYGRDIFLIGKQIGNIVNGEFSGMNLGESQGILMLIIHYHPGIEMNQLKKMMAVDKATVTKLMRKLIMKKYVRKEINGEDKRRFLLFLTKKGEGKIPLIQGKIQAVNDVLVCGLNKKEKSDLLVLLEKVRLNLLKIEDIKEGLIYSKNIKLKSNKVKK